MFDESSSPTPLEEANKVRNGISESEVKVRVKRAKKRKGEKKAGNVPVF